jgi:hypothetical protein
MPNPYPRGRKYYIAKTGHRQWKVLFHIWYEIPWQIGNYSSWNEAMKRIELHEEFYTPRRESDCS